MVATGTRPRPTRQEALDRYRAALGRSPSANQRVEAARCWLVSGTPLTRDGLTEYARSLLEVRYLPSTVGFYLGCVMGLCRANRLVYPGIAMNLDLTPRSVVTASPAFVARLVAAARRAAPPRQLAWLALSTLYGCRAGELTIWRREYLAKDRLWIEAEKASRSRWYWCPPAVAKILARPQWQPVDDREVYDAWGELLDLSGQRRHKGAAWHTIRHGLVRAMEDEGIPAAAVNRFLRWRRGEDPRDRMRRLYAEQVTGELDEDGRVHAIGAAADAQTLDAEVWPRHPYLALWT